MNTKERLHNGCGTIIQRTEKSPEQETLETKAEVLSCGGVYLPPASTPSLQEPTYHFLFLPNYRRGVIMYKNLEQVDAADPEISLNTGGSVAEAGTSHEALRKLFREGFN
ncbi:MAG TPA: hypothetical protein DF383_07580 [Deltaproteobacteria bacterium]|nr:hypothetical protein [Deltaproteobacteria bacterium]